LLQQAKETAGDDGDLAHELRNFAVRANLEALQDGIYPSPGTWSRSWNRILLSRLVDDLRTGTADAAS
jgi:hypothetical protein